VAKLTPPGGGHAGNRFGFAVSIDDNTALVGEPFDNVGANQSGSAYVYVRDGGLWNLQAQLNAADFATNDNFGHRVAIDGNTALVTAILDDDNGLNSGSAYVFVRDIAGNWAQQAKLLAPDGAAGDGFGEWAALDGDTVVIGARSDDDHGSDSGSAYVFVRDAAGNWTIQAKLVAGDAASGDVFGFGVGLHGDTAVIGAVLEDQAGNNAGAAYVFVRDDDGVWTQQAKLTAADGAADRLFGRDIAVYGDTVLIGSIKAPANHSTGGAAYVFVRNAGLWSQQAKLVALDGGDDEFGMSLALETDTAVIGAWAHDHGATDTGAAYVFKRDASGNWSEDKELLASDRGPGQQLSGPGGGVAISNGTVIAGTPYLGNALTGAAYVFQLVTPPSDTDGDGVVDLVDNCVAVANTEQVDSDLDGIGDACDVDNDNDGFNDGADNCPFTFNASQSDADLDGIGDACDADGDGDGVASAVDNCPLVPNADQADADFDGLGDECDADDDNDAVCDIGVGSAGCSAGPDNCPVTFNPDQGDVDGDAVGNACDLDVDGDGVANAGDNCPVDANSDQNDVDADGSGDVCDTDIDDDSFANAADNCPFVANQNQVDLDGDGIGDACDADVDGDGVATTADNCPAVPNSGQNDFDGDAIGDACDTDIDGDTVANAGDQCALTTVGTAVDPASGCSIAQLCPCSGSFGTTVPWRNHGKYVSCVAHVSNDFKDLGLISSQEKQLIMSAAAESSCGK
jgi:hypothetical protein